jgi:hypothetical protein
MKLTERRTLFLVLAALLLTPLMPQSQTRGASEGHSHSTNPSPAGESARKTKLEFRRVVAGEIETPYGVRLGFTNFGASDGVGLQLLYLTEDGKDQAALAFENELVRATKIVQRTLKKDKTGIVTGERALVLMPGRKPTDPPSHAVIWTEGEGFYEIGSSSLKHILELEKSYTVTEGPN